MENIETKMLIESIMNWQKQFTEDINTNYQGKSYSDPIVAAAQIQSLVVDVKILMQWIEILAIKIDELERR